MGKAIWPAPPGAIGHRPFDNGYMAFGLGTPRNRTLAFYTSWQRGCWRAGWDAALHKIASRATPESPEGGGWVTGER